MKVEFYFDIYPWSLPTNVYAYTATSVPEKTNSVKRYKVEVEIPDPIQTDEVLKLNAVEL